MNKVRLFLSSIIFTVLTLSASLYAGISPLAFNGIFNCFKKPEFAPNLGCAALQTGVINNIRFCMVNPGKKDAHGNRLWIEDKAPASDPVAALALLLFPSPAGSLTAVTSHPENIGRHLTVEHIAQLLNFCAHVRTAIPYMGGNRFGKNAHKCIERLIAAANKNLEPHTKNYFTKFFESEVYSLTTASMNTLRSLLKHSQQGRELLVTLCKVIELEERTSVNQQFYPKFQAEQLLNAFFCLKFGHEDIPTLLAYLDDSIVDHEVFPEARLIDASNIELINQKQIDNITLDDLWVLQNKHLINPVVPYDTNSKPINNGLASAYDRERDLLTEQLFPDCTETVIRHLSNLVLYSKNLVSFDLTQAKKQLKDSILWKNLEEFYSLQTPDKANSGEIEIRNSFCKVIGGLENHIRYRKQSTKNSVSNDAEADAGIINILRIINIIYNLQLGSEPVYLNDQQFIKDTIQWTQTGLTKMFQILSPEKKAIIDIANVSVFKTSKNHEYDCKAIINIKVNKDFKCAIKIWSNHAQFESIDILAPEKHVLKQELLKNIAERFKPAFQNGIWESLFLLNEKTKQITQYPFYKLFQNGVNDSTQIIELLDRLLAITQENKISISHSSIILKNCLQMFLWEDDAMVRKIQTTLKKWKDFVKTYDFEELTKALQDEVKIIQYDLSCKDSSQSVDDLLSFFSKASTLSLGGKAPEKLEITHAENLVNLNLRSPKNLKHLKLSGYFKSLKSIDLYDSDIEQLEISAHLPNLKTLTISNTTKLTKIVISGMLENITELDLSNSGITHVELSGEKLPNLKSLNLFGTEKLLTLKLINDFVHLSKITLLDSNISKLHILGACPNLEILELGFTKNLKLIKLSGVLEKLKEISVSNANVPQIKISSNNCPNLKSLMLMNIDCRLGIELFGNFEKLTRINLSGSSIKELKIFGNCPNLLTQDPRIKFTTPDREVGRKRIRDEYIQNQVPTAKKSYSEKLRENNSCKLL